MRMCRFCRCEWACAMLHSYHMGLNRPEKHLCILDSPCQFFLQRLHYTHKKKYFSGVYGVPRGEIWWSYGQYVCIIFCRIYWHRFSLTELQRHFKMGGWCMPRSNFSRNTRETLILSHYPTSGDITDKKWFTAKNFINCFICILFL